MQDYILDLSGKNLYTVYISARRKHFEPDDPDLIMDRLAEMMRGDAAVVDMLPDLYKLAGLSEDFELFQERFEEFLRRSGC